MNGVLDMVETNIVSKRIRDRIKRNDGRFFACDNISPYIMKDEKEELILEIKTVPNEGFEYRKNTGKAKKDHIIQTLIYIGLYNLLLFFYRATPHQRTLCSICDGEEVSLHSLHLTLFDPSLHLFPTYS